MDTTASAAAESVRDKVSAEEWQARVDLAACYRLVAHFGWDDGLATHNSVRVPGAEDHFLLNPRGLMFTEVTASNLVKVDLDGNRVMDTPYEVNGAGFIIHSAVHMARADAKCVMHTHTVAGMAVSAQRDGLLPLNQKSMRFYGRVGYHDYEGLADDLDERQRIVADLGAHGALILRNHGLLTVGKTVAGAFVVMRGLQLACEAQIAAQSGSAPLVTPPPEVCEHAARQFEANSEPGARDWPALLRLLDRLDPSYAE
jgi:ribulose-5-phosphate 4-epimerase/fuculose-1-phosphate aldolase